MKQVAPSTCDGAKSGWSSYATCEIEGLHAIDRRQETAATKSESKFRLSPMPLGTGTPIHSWIDHRVRKSDTSENFSAWVNCNTFPVARELALKTLTSGAILPPYHDHEPAITWFDGLLKSFPAGHLPDLLSWLKQSQ